jgi:hypothetical protein
MCVWTGKAKRARMPMRLISRLKAAGLNVTPAGIKALCAMQFYAKQAKDGT